MAFTVEALCLSLNPPPSAAFSEQELFSWEQVSYYVFTSQIKCIHRTKRVQEAYDQWMKETLANHGSIENYLLTSKLHFPTYSPTDTPSVFLLPNDFPYAIEEGICHLLIWSQTPLENAHIEDILENSYGKELWEWVYWVNPPEIQSVRRLPHVHVFLRQRLYGCM